VEGRAGVASNARTSKSSGGEGTGNPATKCLQKEIALQRGAASPKEGVRKTRAQKAESHIKEYLKEGNRETLLKEKGLENRGGSYQGASR